MSEIRNTRLEELLIDRATDCLSEAEHDELQTLLQQEQLQDDFSYEELVAGMQESYLNTETHALPGHIRSSVISQAESLMQPEMPTVATTPPVHEFPVKENISRWSRRETMAWMATAASVLIALFLIMQPERKPKPLIAAATQSSLNKFIAGASAADTYTLELDAGGHPSGAGCTATVHWNRKLKKGFLSVNNLAVNDPSAEQYQLWIIDKERGFEDRPNAGVFDIAKSGVNIFEFRSDLNIDSAEGFAVTVEKPGGVAKSDLTKISLLNLGKDKQ